MGNGRSASGDEPPPANHALAVDHLRKLEDNLRYWYQAAETKAQVALTSTACPWGFSPDRS